MSNYSLKNKRVLALLLAGAMAISVFTVSPATTAEAASKKVVKGLSVKSTATVEVGRTTNVKATVKAVKKIAKGDLQVSVKTSNKKIVTASISKKPAKKAKSGASTIKLTGKKEGTATVTVTTKATNKKNKKISKKIKVKVTAPQQPTPQQPTTQQPTTQQPTSENPVVKLEKINVTADTTEIAEKGGQAKLTVSPATIGAEIARVDYKSENTQIATVETGIVTGVNPGTTTIQVIAYDRNNNKAEASIQITVREKKTAKIDFKEEDKNVKLVVGEDKKLNPIVTETNTPDYTVEFKSSDSSVATVDKDGVVKAVKIGSATITATVQGTTATATSTVTVVSEGLGIASVKPTHANTLTVALTSPVAENDRAKVQANITNGEDEVKNVTAKWAADGKSLDLVSTKEWAAGTYKVQLTGQDISINESKKSAECIVEKTKLSGLKIRSNYVIYYSCAKIYYDEIDQYGDPNKNIKEKDSSELTWTITSENTTVAFPVIDQGKDYVVIDAQTKVDELKLEKQYMLTATVSAGESIKTTKEIELKKAIVESVTIDASNMPRLYEMSENTFIELPYEAIDTNGEPVDWSAYQNGAYGDSFAAKVVDQKDNVCGKPYIAKGKLGVEILANQSGDTVISVNGNDGVQSEVTIHVDKRPMPSEVGFDDKQVGIPVKEFAEVPVTFIDQYGNKLESGVVTADLFNENFSITNTAETEQKVTVDYVGDKIRINVPADAKTGKYNVNIMNKTTMQSFSYTFEVKEARRPAQIKITNTKIKDTLLVGEKVNIRFEIYDNYNELWTAESWDGGSGNRNHLLWVAYGGDQHGSVWTEDLIINEGKGSFNVTGERTTDNEQEITLEMIERTNNDETIAKTDPLTFTVKPNLSALKVTTDQKEYVADTKVTLTFQALLDGKNLDTYNETVKGVKIYDSVTNDFENVELVFKDGKAIAEVTADKVGDEVKYFGEFMGTGLEEPIQFETTDGVKIKAGAADHFDLVVDGTNVIVKHVDKKNNVVKDKVDKVTVMVSPADIKVVGADKSNKITLTFKEGIATFTLEKELEKNDKITVTGDDFTGEYIAN